MEGRRPGPGVPRQEPVTRREARLRATQLARPRRASLGSLIYSDAGAGASVLGGRQDWRVDQTGRVIVPSGRPRHAIAELHARRVAGRRSGNVAFCRFMRPSYEALRSERREV